MDRNLLFVSRYSDICREFLDATKDKDIAIDVAMNGADAALLLKKKRYDVVVTGLSLDGYNGEQLLTYINKSFPHTVCIVYTTTISPAQLQFVMNKRDVFRVFLRPVDFQTVFWEALEEAYEYHGVLVKNQEDEHEQRLRPIKKEIATISQKLQAQEAGRREMAGYMQRLLKRSVKNYTHKLDGEGKKRLWELERDVVVLCCGKEQELRTKLQSAENATAKIRGMTV